MIAVAIFATCTTILSMWLCAWLGWRNNDVQQ